MGKFTAEEIQIAKAVDLVDLAEQIGIPLKRKGRFYQAVGMDSVMIFNRSSWCRFSQGVGGSWSYVKKKYKLNTTNFLFLCNC